MTRRIALALLAVVALVVCGAVLPLGLLAAAHDRDAFSDATEDQAQVIARSVGPRLPAAASDAAYRAVLAPFLAGGEGLSLLKSGRLVASVGPVPPTVTPDAGEGSGEVRIAGRSYAIARVRLPQPIQREWSVVIVRPAAELDARVHRLWVDFGAVVAGALLAAVAVAWLLSRWVARPLGELSAVSRRIGAGSLGARALVTGPPEVRRLAAAFNTMADRVESLVKRQRSVIADVSHQLRTPLAALRLRLDLLGQGGASADEREVRAVLEEVHRLSRLLDGLLAASRAEARPETPTRLALRPLLAQRVEMWTPLAAERALALTLAPGPSPQVLAVPEHIEQVMDNLLANSFDAAPAPSRVEVAVAVEGDDAVVSVVDDGPGIAPQVRAVVFERFETTRGTTGASGLGLAIVSRLLRSGGGSIGLLETPGGGLTVRFRLPLA